MPVPKHWTVAMHAQRTPVSDRVAPAYRPVDLTVVRAECSKPDPRRVALNLAYLTKGLPVVERRELFKMMGVTR